MQSANAARPLSTGFAALCLVAAAITFRIHARLPYSEPEVTAREVFTSAGGGNLQGFQAASTPQFYFAFIEVFGEAKYERVRQIYDVAERLGSPHWSEVRQRAVASAHGAYEQFRERVVASGREELTKLPLEQRMQLLDQKGSDAFIELGIKALAADQREMIRDVEAFRTGSDRNDFADAQAWTYASSEDKKALGSATALSERSTPEKTTFLDRVGIPLLPASLRAELGAIQRSELQDPAAFKFKYGAPLARAYFEQKHIPVAISTDNCRFAREDSNGGLLRGTESTCVVHAPPDGTRPPVELVLELRKVDERWLVSGMSPPLYVAWPPARGR